MAEFRLLGPVEVRTQGRQFELGRPRQRAVLAALLVDAGRVVMIETLIDRIWGESPPATARHTLYSYVARVRQTLARIGAVDAAAVRLVRRTGGYRLEVDPDDLDLYRFRDLVDRSRGSDVPDGTRVTLLREALDLWSGEPLAGLSGDWVVRVRESWRQEHLDAVVAWAQAELRSGNANAVVGPLTDLTGEHPLAEALAAVLMRALHAVGQPAEALNRYATVRRHLVGELGVEPGAELRAVHQAILRGDLDPPQAAVAATARVPAQLPADVRAFTGRCDELAELDRLLDGGTEPQAVLVAAVSGTAGVGKTALVIRWANRARDRFPDGQLFLNLRGYDPDQPMTADDALAQLLTALGVPARDIPADLADRAARFRTETADRRMLIVLDNARAVEQIRPLLPGTPSCVVLVTSRDSLAGLVAVHGARRVDLDLLPRQDAIALLRRLIGVRVGAEPAAAATLSEQCARLPLALRVAAELAVSRSGIRLADLVAELADQQGRLELLDAGGDPHAAVAAVFSRSVRHLPAEAARTFTVLGLHPGPDFDLYAAAALAGLDLAHTRRVLDLLARAHLVHATAGGRHGMHDLLRAYASGPAGAARGEAPRAALDRLFDYYLAAAACAIDALYPAEAQRRPRIPRPATPLPSLTDPDTALAWLDNERHCLTTVTAYAAAHGWPSHALRLASTLFRYLDCGGYHLDSLAIYGHAYRAAQRTDDQAGQAQGLIGLGTAYSWVGRYALAADHFRAALTLRRRAGDAVGEAWALTNLGIAERRLGSNEPAVSHHQQALVLFRQAGHATGEAGALTNLGLVESSLGRQASAAEHFQQALALARRTGDRIGEAHSLDNLGTVLTCLGRPDQAADHHRQALALFREYGDREGETWALNGLGEAAHAGGDSLLAQAQHTAALAIATQTGAKAHQARAHSGLGHAHHALNEIAQARQAYRSALALYDEIQSPDADSVRMRLAGLSSHQ